MRSVDDLAEKHRALTFVDFLEALCRVFLLFPVPSAAALDEMRSRQITEFFVGIAKLVDAGAMGDQRVFDRAAQESEIPNFKGSDLGRFPLVSANFWTSDHLSERSRSVDAFAGTRARGTLMLKRT